MSDEFPSSRDNLFTRMGERLAALEARSTTEIAALKSDTEAIRKTMHESNNTLTAFIGTQIAANTSFKSLTDTLADHVKLCDRRGQILNRAAWSGVSLLIGILGFLIVHGAPWSHP